MNAKFTILATQMLISARGIETGGKVQKFIDSEVLRLTDPYVPKDVGTLKGSGTTSTRIGSGDVKYSTPYARRQYYEHKGNGLRGSRWFDRSKADNKQTILNGALKLAGAKS